MVTLRVQKVPFGFKVNVIKKDHLYPKRVTYLRIMRIFTVFILCDDYS
jgi:hypothetical protein